MYAVALGFIGLFNMYNALEIFKKKEQIDRELNEMVSSYKDAINNFEINRKELGVEYQKMELDLNIVRNEIQTEFRNISSVMSTIKGRIKSF